MTNPKAKQLFRNRKYEKELHLRVKRKMRAIENDRMFKSLGMNLHHFATSLANSLT